MALLLGVITAAFAAGIVCGSFCTVQVIPAVYTAFFIALVWGSWRIYYRTRFYAPLAVIFFLAGALRFVHDDTQAANDIGRYAGKQVIQGTIADVPKLTNLAGDKNKMSFRLAVHSMQYGAFQKTVSGQLAVTVMGINNVQKYQQGDTLQIAGEIFPLHGYNNPGQYDTVAALKRQGISARLKTRDENVDKLSQNPSALLYAADSLKEKIKKNMMQVMPTKDAAILSGMLFGGYDNIPPQVVKDFAATGIVHILSVSGSHIAILAGVVIALGRRLKKWVDVNDAWIIAIAALIISLYGLVCGLTPPVLRSLIMGLIGLGGMCFERDKDAGAALWVTGLGMLAHQPSLLYDLSFQLSFGATCGLVYFYKVTLEKIGFLPQGIAELLAVTIAAQMAVLPFLAWYFYSLPVISLAANIIVTPVIETVIIWGLISCLASVVVFKVGSFLLIISSILVGLMVFLAGWLAKMPGASIYLPSFGIWGGLIYYGALMGIYGYWSFASIWAHIKRNPRFAALVVSTVFLCIAGWRGYNHPLYVHFIDVGQGDAALVITPHGKAILVDTGGLMGQSSFDIGERVVSPYLKHYGIQKINYLFLTHGHQDHAGGAAAITKDISIQNIFLSREEPSLAIRNLLQSGVACNFIPVFKGQCIRLDGVNMEVIYAVQGHDGRHANEASGVLRVSYGKHSFLFTGDLDAKGEMAIVKNGTDIRSTVLKVGHHGAKTSSTAAFLQAVAPQYAIISVGMNNSFGHPHKETLDRLAKEKARIYRTDRQGAIVFETDGQELNVTTFIK